MLLSIALIGFVFYIIAIITGSLGDEVRIGLAVLTVTSFLADLMVSRRRPRQREEE